MNNPQGPSIKYVSTFLAIFDPSLPHVSNCQPFETPLKVHKHFQNLHPPFQTKKRNIHASKKLIAVYMVKHSLIFVYKLLYQNIHDFVKRYLLLLLLLAKYADVSTLDIPLPLMSATVSIFRTPPPSKMLTYFMDGPSDYS